jgi:hypothetical protein
MKKRHVSEWRTLGMLEYLTKLNLLHKNGEVFQPTESLKKAFHQNLIDFHHKGELHLETLEDKISESLLLTLREHGFFKEAKTTRDAAFAVEVLRAFGDDEWVEKLVKALGV